MGSLVNVEGRNGTRRRRDSAGRDGHCSSFDSRRQLKCGRTTPSIADDMSASPDYLRSRELLGRDDSRLLIVDVQGKLTVLIPGAAVMIANCRRLIRGAKLLGVPVSATEQYPRGLGPTVPELAELLDPPIEKVRFSSAECLDWVGGDKGDRVKVIVAGIEAHVCIQQTALDLLAAGFSVYIPADAVASRSTSDRDIACQRLRDAGATITTTESVLFEWCETAGAAEFKQISALIKEGDGR
jgi:isochorismate hydrolase